MKVLCSECGSTVDFDICQFRCACGGAWEPMEQVSFSREKIKKELTSIWRYQEIINIDEITTPVTMGSGWTPLIHTDMDNAHIHFKLEYISPTGSFKDRGTELEVNFLKKQGVREVVEDSSGNAGASLAACAARIRMKAVVYVPESVSPAKLAQIQVYGASLKAVPGVRKNATEAVLRAVEAGAVYSSHAWNPVYLLGQQTFAWEIWEQMDGDIPDAVVIPVGQGGLLLGTWLGFHRLLHAGLIQRIPRLFAVQPESMAPICYAFNKGLDKVLTLESTSVSIAEGLAIAQPVRGRRILQCLRESSGAALTVTESAIKSAYHTLAEKGFFVEPTSAVAAAALPQVWKILGKSTKIVVALTGSGLKTPPMERRL